MNEESKSMHKQVNITDEQKQISQQFLQNYRTLFVQDEYDLGRTNMLHYSIDVGDSRPIRQSSYQLNIKQSKIVDEEIDKS